MTSQGHPRTVLGRALEHEEAAQTLRAMAGRATRRGSSRVALGVVTLAGPGREDQNDLGAVLASDAVPLARLERDQHSRSSLDDITTRLDPCVSRYDR